LHLRKCVHNMQHKWKCRLENILFLGPKCTNFPNAPHGACAMGSVRGRRASPTPSPAFGSGSQFRNWTAFFVELCADCNSFGACVCLKSTHSTLSRSHSSFPSADATCAFHTQRKFENFDCMFRYKMALAKRMFLMMMMMRHANPVDDEDDEPFAEDCPTVGSWESKGGEEVWDKEDTPNCSACAVRRVFGMCVCAWTLGKCAF